MRIRILALVAVVAIVASGSPASAETVTFNLEQGSNGGFGFSWLHPGSGTTTNFAMNGDPKSRVDGSFSGNWTAATSLLTGVTGSFTTQNTNMNPYFGANATEQLTVHILDGKLRGGLTTGGLPGGDLAGGYLEYEIWGSDNGKLNEGQFSFYTMDYAPSASPGPNSLTYPSPGHDFALWGNNWVSTNVPYWGNIANSIGMPGVFSGQPDGTGRGFLRLGTDLRGPGTAPEPAGLVLFGIAAAFIGYRRRKAA